MSDEDAELQQIALALRGLTLSATRQHGPGGSSSLQISISEDPLPGPAAGGASSGGQPPPPTSGRPSPPPARPPPAPPAASPSSGPAVGLEEESLPDWLGPPQPVEPPAHVLRGAGRLSTASGLSGEARLRRAYTAGREAAAVIRGDKQFPAASEPLELERKVYVVLGAPGLPRPVWTKRKRAFKKLIDGNDAANLFIGFPSPSEAQAYLFGVGIVGDVPEHAEQ